MVGTRRKEDNNVYCLPVDRPLPMAVRKILFNGADGRHQPPPPIFPKEVKDLNQPNSNKEFISDRPLKLLSPTQGDTNPPETPLITIDQPQANNPDEHGNIIVSTENLQKITRENLT